MAASSYVVAASLASPARVPAVSTEFVRVAVRVTQGLKAIDPTALSADVALAPAGSAPVFHAADWDQDGSAAVLIGPGADQGTPALHLGTATYRVFVRLDVPGEEKVVRLAGRLQVF